MKYRVNIILYLFFGLFINKTFSQVETQKISTLSLISINYDNDTTKIFKHKIENENYIKTTTLIGEDYISSSSFLFKNRYIIDYVGRIYDLENNKYIYNFGFNKFDDIGIFQNRLYYYKDSCYKEWRKTINSSIIDTCNCYSYYDFNSKSLNKITSISEYPYIYNGKSHFSLMKKELLIVYFKNKAISFGEKFSATAYNGDDDIIPFLWLSDTTFLSQLSNGILVKSDTAGNIDTIAIFPKITKLQGMANLYIDSTGVIVYEFFKSKPVFAYKFHNRYKIDIINKNYQEYVPIFEEGSFSYKIKKNKYYYYQNDNLLLKKDYYVNYDRKTKIHKNFLAVEKKKKIMVFNSNTHKWITIDNPNGALIIGWIEK